MSATGILASQLLRPPHNIIQVFNDIVETIRKFSKINYPLILRNNGDSPPEMLRDRLTKKGFIGPIRAF